MASVTLLNQASRWHVGTTVTAYPYVEIAPINGAPPGQAPVDTDVVSTAGSVTFTGLESGKNYWAVGGSPSKWVQFQAPDVKTSATSDVPIDAGNLGAAYTLDMTDRRHVMLEGTLTANCTLTISNVPSFMTVELLLVQDATGGRTLTISDGSDSEAAPISSSAGATSFVTVLSPDGDDLYISVA